jgi:hypothetical protein
MKRLAVAVAVVASASAPAAGAGCAYDWTVGRAAASEGGADAAPVEASAETGDDATPGDATQGPDSDAHADAAADAGGDATAAEAGPSCAQLEATVRSTQAGAVGCTPGGTACTATTNDECGCPVRVGDGASSKTSAFMAAVSEFVDAGCRSTIVCPDACPAVSPQPLCVVGDAAATYDCYP